MKKKFIVCIICENKFDNDVVKLERNEVFNREKDAVAYLTDYSLNDAKSYNLKPNEFKIERTSYENFKMNTRAFIITKEI